MLWKNYCPIKHLQNWKKKLIKKIIEQNINAKIALMPFKLVNDFDLKPPLDGEWY